jgi:cell division protein FtsZ
MNEPTSPESSLAPSPTSAGKPLIKIVGVGNAGLAVLDRIVARGIDSVELLAINTDPASLAASAVPAKIFLENKLLRGLGTGGDPERGRQLADEELTKLKPLFEGVARVFIVAGLGGGAGSGICPVLAKAAKEAGALTLAFVTTPFDCEGSRRRDIAVEALDELKAAGDGVICLPNQKVLKLIDENTSLIDTFKSSNDLLADGVQGVWRLLAHRGLIEIHFADFCKLLRDRHTESALGVAEASGLDRSQEVIQKLFAHPLLEGGEILGESDAILVSLLGGPDLTMAQINRVMEQIQNRCDKARVMMGAAVDESFRDRLSVTLIAARKNGKNERYEVHGNGGSAEDLDEQLINRGLGARPPSRFVPPPPSLPEEKMQKMLAKQGRGARTGKGLPKMRQTQLQLEIISKGRFDKSEPTIHQGEDLDVPTYIRRGISLN